MAAGSDGSFVWNTWDPASCTEAEWPLPGQASVGEQRQDASSRLTATEWPLKRYGRFVAGGLGATSGSWEVLESNTESGILTLTIVISGHFFISRGKKVLEGFSLIDASQWLKIVRNADCMLFGSKSKNRHRMFRIQFVGDSKTQTEEHCHNCAQKLAEYVPIEVMSASRQELQPGHRQLIEDKSHLKDADQNIPKQPSVDNPPPAQGRASVAELAQCMLTSNSALPVAYQQSRWSAEDLGSFIRLCLLDQTFPAFVEEVEKQLKKITEG